jgi:hypothetical protein
MIGRNETFYQVVPTPPARSKPLRTQTAAR